MPPLSGRQSASLLRPAMIESPLLCSTIFFLLLCNQFVYLLFTTSTLSNTRRSRSIVSWLKLTNSFDPQRTICLVDLLGVWFGIFFRFSSVRCGYRLIGKIAKKQWLPRRLLSSVHKVKGVTSFGHLLHPMRWQLEWIWDSKRFVFIHAVDDGEFFRFALSILRRLYSKIWACLSSYSHSHHHFTIARTNRGYSHHKLII